MGKYQLSKEDQQLIADLKQGGKAMEMASEKLLQSCQGFLGQAIKRKQQLSTEELKDAYTDAVVLTIRSIIQGRFEQDASIATFLGTIFERRITDQLRHINSQKIQQWENRVPEVPAHLTSPLKGPEEQMILSEKYRGVYQRIGELSELCQQVIRLWLKGFSPKEIAEQLGKDRSDAVRVKKHHCLKQLKAMYP